MSWSRPVITIVMNTPLRNCFTKCCFELQSLNSNMRLWGSAHTFPMASHKPMPSMSLAFSSINTSAPIRHNVCRKSVHTMALMPLIRV